MHRALKGYIDMNSYILSEAIENLNSGMSIKDLIEQYSITLDQAKKISQISNMQKSIGSLEQSLQEKFINLGYKALVLNPLFKDNDIDGIREILESIDTSIKRDDLKLMPEALRIKRDRLKNAKINAEIMVKELKDIELETEIKIQELEENKKKIEESMSFLSDVEDTMAKEFLMEHLGVAKGKIVLYKRLDISWQQALKRKGTIKYNESTFTWEITDLTDLKRQAERRVKNNNNMYYDPDKATGIYASYYPDNPVYKNAAGLSISILEAIKGNERELKELKKKRKEINKNLQKLKSTNIQTYLESAEVANHLSEHDILKHRKLQNAGMRYLYNADNVAVVEVPQDNYRFDVIGYNQSGNITIIEAKASIEDFRTDNKFDKYIYYCNKMYFIFDEDTYIWYRSEIDKKLESYNIGILVENKDNAIVKIESGIWHMLEDERYSLMFRINRILSRKFIYGR